MNKRMNRMIAALAGLLVAVTAGSASPAMAQTRVQGVDVSVWQGAMNWNQTYDAGARFAFVRASRGGLASSMGRLVDTRFVENMTAIESLAADGKTIYAGAYHYARPDLLTATSPAAIAAHARDEATHFVNIAGGYMTAGWLRPVLDLEEALPNGGKAELSHWANSFLDEVERRTGVEPLVYMNRNFATHHVDQSLAHRDLWIADWAPMRDPDGYPDLFTDHPGPGTGVFDQWAFWQYSGDTNGYSGPWGSLFGASSVDIDLNVANGDINFVRGFLIPEPSGLVAAAGAGLLLLRRRR